MALTAKREAFINALIEGKTQREAYRIAYDAENMSENTIDRRASELFKKSEVRARYDEQMDKIAEHSIASAQEVLEEYTKIAFGKKTFISYTITGEEVERLPGVTARLEALKQLGKHHKLFTEKIEEKSDITVKVVIGGKNKEYAE